MRGYLAAILMVTMGFGVFGIGAGPASAADKATKADGEVVTENSDNRCWVAREKRGKKRVKCKSSAAYKWYVRTYCFDTNGTPKRICLKPYLAHKCWSGGKNTRNCQLAGLWPASPRAGVDAGAGGTAQQPRIGLAVAGMTLFTLGSGLGLAAMRRRRASEN